MHALAQGVHRITETEVQYVFPLRQGERPVDVYFARFPIPSITQ